MTKNTSDTLTIAGVLLALAGILAALPKWGFYLAGLVLLLTSCWVVWKYWEYRRSLQLSSNLEPHDGWARKGDLEEVCALYAKEFGDEAPTLKQMRGWYDHNPQIFRIIEEVDSRTCQRTIVASYKVVPLTATALQMLNRGLLTGSKFTVDDIAGNDSEPKGWYIGDLIGNSEASKKLLMNDLLHFVRDNVEPTSPLYARGLTPKGFGYLKSYGFQPISDCPMAIGCVCVLQGDGLSSLLQRLQARVPSRPTRTHINSLGDI